MDKDITKKQEEIIKKDIKKEEKIWKDIDNNDSLEYHLDKMTKDELIKIANNYSIKGITSLKKSQLVERIGNVIVENIDYALELLDLDAYRYLEEVIKLYGKKQFFSSEIINANYFRNRGIMFTAVNKGKLYAITPKELCDIIKNKFNDKLRLNSKINSEVIELSAGIIYFYGVLTIQDLCKFVIDVYKYDISIDKIKKLLLNGEELGFDYQIEEDIIYHIDVEDPMFIIEERNKNANISFMNFERKTLFKASKPDYIEENKEVNKLEKVLNELFIIDKKILKEELESFSIAIKNEVPLIEAVEVFLEAYEIESEEEEEILKEELKKLAMNVKRWTLKGHSEKEIENKKKTIKKENSIGRNDICPCGSNKKYKKCCGK